MPLPPLPSPPRGAIVDGEGRLTAEGLRWFDLLYRKLGQAGEIPSESLPPNAAKNTTNDAKVDSIDAGSSATVRVYGPGGVGTPWNRYGNGVVIGTHPANTFTGKAYATRYYIGFSVKTGAWTISTAYKDVTFDDMVIFSVLTVSAGGGGGAPGGGGSGDGGSGGVRGDLVGFGLVL